MATEQPVTPIVVGDLRGGQNNTDPPMSLPFNQAVRCVNIDWKDATLAHKRGGSIAVSTTGGTAFSAGLQTLIRHVPGNTDTAAELWGVDGAATPIVKRLTGGTSFANVTLDDAISSRPQDVVGASLNGKVFLAYDSSEDRLHVYDPSLSSPRVRRVGLATPAAISSSANSGGGGAYPAVLRYVRVRWVQLNGTIVVRRSEPGAGFATTPSGANASLTYTRPTAPGEGETHWDMEVSADNVTWYVLSASILIATTTYVDTTLAAAYTGLSLSDPIGFYGLFPSVKVLITDGNRLIGAGAWESAGATSGGKTSRIWFTPVLGSSDHGDDERVPNQTTQKNWVDVNENDGGGVTGLGGPVNGMPWYFKFFQVGKLRPTGDPVTPYLPRRVRSDIGSINHKTIAVGEDQSGNAALYFLSHRGPYRITLDGDIQYLGRDNEVTWRTMNLSASSVVAHSLYYPDLHHWEVWIATGTNDDPDTCMVMDVQRGFPDENGQIRGGWVEHTGDKAGARCATLFANTLGASMSRNLKPYIGRSTGTTLFKLDTTDLNDNGTSYRAYVTTRPLLTTKDLTHKMAVTEPTLIAKAQAGQSVTIAINRDFGKDTSTPATVSLTPATTETRVVKKVDGLELGEADAVEMTIGDADANDLTWTVDALITPVSQKEAR